MPCKRSVELKLLHALTLVRELFVADINMKRLANLPLIPVTKQQDVVSLDWSESCMVEVVGLEGSNFKRFEVQEVEFLLNSLGSAFALKLKRIAKERARCFFVVLADVDSRIAHIAGENSVSHVELDAGLLRQMLRKMLKVIFKAFCVFFSVFFGL